MSDKRKRGYIFADAVIALMIAAVLSTLLAVSVNASARGRRGLSDSRQAMRLAEEALSDLQLGRASASAPQDTSIQVKDLTDAPAVANWRWVTVTANVNHRTAILIGLVSQASKERP
jgi:type II secretory pathway pseudopilin PulG